MHSKCALKLHDKAPAHSSARRLNMFLIKGAHLIKANTEHPANYLPRVETASADSDYAP